MLLSANIYTLLFADTLFECALDRIWYVLVVAVGYLVGLLLFRVRTFLIIQGIAQMLFLPIEVSSLYLNGQPVSMQYMYWIIATNRGEATELLMSVWWLVLIVFLIWGLYGWLTACVPAEMRWMTRKRWVPRTVLAWMVLAMLTVHFVYLNGNYVAPEKSVYVRIYAWSFGMRVGNVFPYDIYLQTFRAYKHMREIDGIASLSDYRFGIAPRPDSDSALYVLVIGEAARYANFSLNGEYERETTPYLSRQPNLVSFSHAYAQANATDLSVPLMITRASAEDPMLAYREKTVLGAFQEAGYKTAWISADAAPIRYVLNILPSFDTVWIATDDTMDEVLFEPFHNLLDGVGIGSASSLVVLHTKGSHLNYQDRYPEQFDVFEPSLKKGVSYGTFDKQLMTNTYDNTILYTDYILHSLIQALDSTGRCTCLLYMPDHGENLCDDERKLWVHGTYEGSEWEYHVPLLVWYSDTFQRWYPEKVQALQANRDKTVTSQVIFHSLCDMAGLNEVVNEHYSLLSDSLEVQDSVFVLNGKGEIIQGQYR
jgi:glucan phosphoethanolaminetransferase (alkaline phosphatase superfamily)